MVFIVQIELCTIEEKMRVWDKTLGFKYAA